VVLATRRQKSGSAIKVHSRRQSRGHRNRDRRNTGHHNRDRRNTGHHNRDRRNMGHHSRGRRNTGHHKPQRLSIRPRRHIQRRRAPAHTASQRRTCSSAESSAFSISVQPLRRALVLHCDGPGVAHREPLNAGQQPSPAWMWSGFLISFRASAEPMDTSDQWASSIFLQLAYFPVGGPCRSAVHPCDHHGLPPAY
jgi:hypothetical protein